MLNKNVFDTKNKKYNTTRITIENVFTGEIIETVKKLDMYKYLDLKQISVNTYATTYKCNSDEQKFYREYHNHTDNILFCNLVELGKFSFYFFDRFMYERVRDINLWSELCTNKHLESDFYVKLLESDKRMNVHKYVNGQALDWSILVYCTQLNEDFFIYAAKNKYIYEWNYLIIEVLTCRGFQTALSFLGGH